MSIFRYNCCMFKPKTERIKEIAQKNPLRIAELEKFFNKPTMVYIDFANIRPLSGKLGWHIDPKRLKQFFDGFENIKEIRFYSGTLSGDKVSEEFVSDLGKFGYVVKTKPVKIIKKPIDVTSINLSSPDILKNFVRMSLLQKLKVETVEYLNNELAELNKQGIFYIEDRKCNFDVEIGCDMLMDNERNGIENYILWSGDSDFADVASKLLHNKKKVIVFSTVRKISSELSELSKEGLLIFDIQKIRDFICWKKELS